MEQLETARAAVLTNPDLVERILALLPVPKLWLGSKEGITQDREQGHLKRGRRHARVTAADRWAAGQASRAFRRAALDLPWEAYLEPYSSRPNISANTLAHICGPRNLVTIRVGLHPRAQASCAALLCHASSVQVLRLSFGEEYMLLGWLQHTHEPGPCQGTSVLICLTSLSRLTSLQVGRDYGGSWANASGLTAVSQLKHLLLHSYAGPPVGTLPRLQSLEVHFGWHEPTRQPQTEHALVDWAQPRLTALRLKERCLQIRGPAKGGETEQSCAAWLRQLQHLSLARCCLRVHSVSLQALVPGLTYLNLDYSSDTNGSLCALLSSGLPLSLKELHIASEYTPVEVLRSAVFALSNLACVSITQWQSGAESDEDEQPGAEVDEDGIAAALQSLTAMPNLTRAFWGAHTMVGVIECNWDRASGAFRRSSRKYL